MSKQPSITFELPPIRSKPKTDDVEKKTSATKPSKTEKTASDTKEPKKEKSTKKPESDMTRNREGKMVERKIRISEPGNIGALSDTTQYDLFRTRGFFALHGISAIIHFSMLLITILLSNWNVNAPIFSTNLVDEPNSNFIRTVWTKTIVYLVPIFTYLHGFSFTFHLGTLFLWRRPYLRWRKDAMSPLRWLHSSLTSPVRSALIIYAAGIHEASAIALIFLIRLIIHFVSLSNEFVSRSIDGNTWTLSSRTRFWLCIMVLTAAFIIWVTATVLIINVNVITNSVDNTFGIVLFATHSIFIVISYANHGIFLLQKPSHYFRSEYLAIISESLDAVVTTILFLVYILQKEEYMWGNKAWGYMR